MGEFAYDDAYRAYLLGNFQAALKGLQKIRSNDEKTKLKIDILMYRIYIAQKKFGVVLDEIPEDSDQIELRLLRILALFSTNPTKRDEFIAEADKIMSGALNPDDETALILAAMVYLNAGAPERALKILHNGSDISCSALSVQCLMSMHRYDLAGKAVRRMQVADEDALPCQLATAMFYVTKGGEQLQEALHIYEELREKYGATSVILNGQATALIGMNRWEEAESVLQEALDLDGNNPDIIANLIMVSHHLSKPPETVNRLISQLKDCNKDHPLLMDFTAKEEEFTRCAQQYAPSVPN